MTFSMALFAIEDGFIKQLAIGIPAGEIVAALGMGGALIFVVWFLLKGEAIWTQSYLDRLVLQRTGFEALGTACYSTALALIPLTTASAVIQATPLFVAMGAAVFLGQTVGWRRWLAILVGFAGVLLIIRPGTEAFAPATILAVLGTMALASRDLTTRALNVPITGSHISLIAFVALIPTGLLVCAVQGQSLVVPNMEQTIWLVLMTLVAMGAYLSIVAATRTGDAAVTASFRYSRMIFALIVGFIMFRETPDMMTILGVTIVIAAGLFTLIREARLARSSQLQKPAL